ncbi:uncharacterized protein LOC129577983 [Sitodiplosis mosellana]|uniref:uncharacterized protein LOC129577983 n=1 Tax=Sitodiplosis mosellana TaxID=263140 RepID=UPI0024451D8C|nr:uncharacterized protein LOC129577983 [Sitodiplosis mosellana]
MWKLTFFSSILFVICTKVSSHSKCSGPQITKIQTAEALFPYSLIWESSSQSLYYVDFLGSSSNPIIFRYDFEEDKIYSASIAGQQYPSFILPIKSKNKTQNLFAVGVGHFTEIVEWDGRSPTANIVSRLFGVEESDSTSGVATARTSDEGIFYGGTHHTTFCSGPKNSSFYTYTKMKGLQQLFTGTQTTDGLTFYKDILYHFDPCSKVIKQFRLNPNGNISRHNSSQIFINLDTDTDGFVYTNEYGGNSVWKLDVKSHKAEVVAKLPINGTSSFAFGGPNRDILFVSAASTIVDAYTLAAEVISQNGSSLYKVTGLGITGRKYSPLIV